MITPGSSLRPRPRAPVEAPGLGSHWATELLTQAGSAEVGLGADVVLTPQDPETSFFHSPVARADVARIQEAVAALPKVLGTTDPASALLAGRQAAVESESSRPTARSPRSAYP